MMTLSKRLSTLAVAAAFCAPASVLATNGMNLEGYGPIALGMGGASMAYDNGTAAVMNNPATLGLMADGASRLDAAVGLLGPDVKSSSGSESWSSSADAFYMPAVGWAARQQEITYGVGLFAQGGMGTEYKPGPGAWMSSGYAQSKGAGATMIATAGGLQERSELSVGRLIVPLVYNIDEKLSVGGSIDYVWATMDLQMAMPGNMMDTMISQGLMTGTMMDGLAGAEAAGYITQKYYGYFDFSDGNDFNGKTNADGFAGKLGLTFKVSEALTLGASYHSKTSMGDLTGPARVSFGINADTGYFQTGTPNSVFADFTATLDGEIAIRDFQWPETYGIGMAFKASPALMVAADIKLIKWSDVMSDFQMTFTASDAASNGGFAGKTMNATLPQNWDDQTVLQVGAAYAQNADLTWRFGANIADNPIPDSTINYLFPAIIKEHYTAGVGYDISKQQGINFALSYAPEVSVRNTQTQIKTTHSQTNWQLMYSVIF